MGQNIAIKRKNIVKFNKSKKNNVGVGLNYLIEAISFRLKVL